MAHTSWVWARTSDRAIAELSASRSLGTPIDTLALDHDLGILDLEAYALATREADVYEGPADYDDTAMRVVEWLEQRDDIWPRIVSCHSSNPAGAANMLRALSVRDRYRGIYNHPELSSISNWVLELVL